MHPLTEILKESSHLLEEIFDMGGAVVAAFAWNDTYSLYLGEYRTPVFFCAVAVSVAGTYLEPSREGKGARFGRNFATGFGAMMALHPNGVRDRKSVV